MSTTKKNLYEVRTNTKFHLNYDTLELVPQIELIFLTHEVHYQVVSKKGKTMIAKGASLGEFRMHCDIKDLNDMIGQLQATAAGLQQFEQLAVGLSRVIQQAKKTGLSDAGSTIDEGA
jgi:hypothetical protein